MSNQSIMETRNRNGPVEVNEDGNSADVPSGFILKLYQMVNGAPDEVISWTPVGDAFIIGSDLKRLESETLPQYFRHNRFQSLVRQLNFYSFRKINRERNVWIYKHELFHRDHPGDLHMVRRRTCPGLDGRKQRFSRFSARKLSDNLGSGSDDDCSTEEMPHTESSVEHIHERGTKRDAEDFIDDEQLLGKKSRVIWNSGNTGSSPKTQDLVDISLLVEPAQEKTNEVEEEPTLTSPLNERAEMVERSLIISEVAKKLESYARKAYGSVTGKGKRHSSGVVTPPFGKTAPLRTTNLLTYDDEYNNGKETTANTDVVTDSDESTSCGDDETGSPTSPLYPNSCKNFCTTPAGDVDTARDISERLMGLPIENCDAKAAVASFCIMNTPHGDKDIGSKILQLIGSCNTLATWFYSYRTALQPCCFKEKENVSVSYLDLESGHWAREVSRLKAIHDFQIFAVNCVHGILVNGSAGYERDESSLTKKDEFVLERAIQVWSKNV